MRPNVLTIAGFDPTGGAGILADIKTFEACKCYGFAVQTANTIQTAHKFFETNWVARDVILNQLDVILNQYRFSGIKIGLIQSIPDLNQVILKVNKHQPQAKIIWDPIVKTSSGFSIHSNLEDIEGILPKIYMLTPNWNEVKYFGVGNVKSSCQKWSTHTKIYLKGGHHPCFLGKDLLFLENTVRGFNPNKECLYPKHGSGCVLSSALISHLSRGYPLQKAILRSKRYVEKFLDSNKSLLGTHRA